MQAHLAEVFENDVFAFDEGFFVFGAVGVGRAVFTVAEAFVFFEGLVAGGAGPCDEAGLEFEPGAEAVAVLVELFDKV